MRRKGGGKISGWKKGAKQGEGKAHEGEEKGGANNIPSVLKPGGKERTLNAREEED